MNPYQELAQTIQAKASELGLKLVTGPYNRVVARLRHQPHSRVEPDHHDAGRTPFCDCARCDARFRFRPKSWRPIMLDWEGIALLKQDLKWTVASETVRFNQWVFGSAYRQTHTELSMAELCYLRSGGLQTADYVGNENYAADCLEAGIRQLGLSWTDLSFREKKPLTVLMKRFAIPEIFNLASYWPIDLARAYESSNSVAERVDVACRALDRMDNHGSIMTLDELQQRPRPPLIKLDGPARRVLTYWTT